MVMMAIAMLLPTIEAREEGPRRCRRPEAGGGLEQQQEHIDMH